MRCTRTRVPWRRFGTSYERGITDEFVEPIVITQEIRHGQSAVPVGMIRDDDAVIFTIFAPIAPGKSAAPSPNPASKNLPIPPAQRIYFLSE